VAVERTFYRLADEPHEAILVACSKCEWKAAFLRAELIALHGSDYPMPSLLERLPRQDAPGSGSSGTHVTAEPASHRASAVRAMRQDARKKKAAPNGAASLPKYVCQVQDHASGDATTELVKFAATSRRR
jgi:hypothetical protein